MVGILAICALSLQSQPKGFLAEPKGGKGQGVLVLHAWWGLNADVKAVCNRLASQGYVAFAPDLFQGKVATTVPEASELVKSAKEAVVDKEIVAATGFLSKRTVKPLAVIGFSFGAYYALKLSNTDPKSVRSVVVFYGTGDNDFSKSKASYLGHFAQNDEFEPKESVDGLGKALERWKRPATIHTYPGTGHWFFEPSRADAYDKAASDLAWQRTLAFLKKSK